MCYSCNRNLTNDEKVIYNGKEFCERCIIEIYNTIPKVLEVYLQEDVIEECFQEFA